MNAKITSLAAAVALVTGMSAANAEEAIKLTAAEMDTVTAGSGISLSDYQKHLVLIDVKDTKKFEVDVKIDGNTSFNKSDAVAVCGYKACDTSVQTFTDAFVKHGEASFGTSVGVAIADKTSYY